MSDLSAYRTNRVYRTCLRYVQNPDEANDLAQEVLMKLAGKGQSIPVGPQASAWWHRVAANHCLDHLRRTKRRRQRVESFVSESGPSYAVPGEGDDEWVHPTSRQVLETLRRESGETDRRVIHLRFDLGLNPTDIARLLGVSRGAIAQRLTRIRVRAIRLWQVYAQA